MAPQSMRLMAHVPLLLRTAAPGPADLLRRRLTASTIAAHPTLDGIDIVDRNEQVFATAPEFVSNRGVVADARGAVFSFVAVFPHSFVFTDAHTNCIAVGGNGDLSLGNLERRFAGLPSVGDDRRPFGVLSARDLLARFTRSPDQLVAEFGGDALVVGDRGRVGRRSGVCCV